MQQQANKIVSFIRHCQTRKDGYDVYVCVDVGVDVGDMSIWKGRQLQRNAILREVLTACSLFLAVLCVYVCVYVCTCIGRELFVAPRERDEEYLKHR